MTERLPHKQTAAMLALMALARKVANQDLRELVGFTLDGEHCRALNGLGLIESAKTGPNGSLEHELTEQGWAWCAHELSTGRPPAPDRSTVARSTYLLLAGFSRHLRLSGLTPADALAATTGPTPDPTPTTDAASVEKRIRDTYRRLARAPRDWVPLVDLRPLLGAPTADVDGVLRELVRTGKAHLVPDSNRKALTDTDHAAAIRIGGEDNHLLSIEVS